MEFGVTTPLAGDPVEKRILIWGKTYPELSAKHFETVCTGGVFEDGSPVRLYPISLRYLDDARLKKYSWIKAKIYKSAKDTRPESYRVIAGSIVETHQEVDTDKYGWRKRSAIVFKNPVWQFACCADLFSAHDKTGASIGVIKPASIQSVTIEERPEEERTAFLQKRKATEQILQEKKRQVKLFDYDEFIPDDILDLEYLSARIYVQWTCDGCACPGHSMGILDWEVTETQRKFGHDVARSEVERRCDLQTYDLRFYLGNLFTHPRAFTIVGLWYPKHYEDPNPRLPLD